MYTNVNDYIPQLKEMFPSVDEKDIKKIIEYGWRMFYFYNLRGCDVLLESSKYKYWMYCGDLCNDPLKHFNYYKSKLRRKFRVLYGQKHKEWDGYYYTYLTEDEYNDFIKGTTGRGRKRKNFKFKDKDCFKLLDEAKVYYDWAKYIIKFKYVSDMGYSFHKDELKCTEVEICFQRESTAKFKDIIINNNKYDAI